MAEYDENHLHIDHKETCNNIHVGWIVKWIDVALIQMSQCGSASHINTIQQDADIIERVVREIRDTYEIAKSKPAPLHMPNYHPHPQVISHPPTVKRTPNPHIHSIMSMLAALRTQFLFDPTVANMSTGISKAAALSTYDPAFEELEEFVQQCKDAVDDPVHLPEIDTPQTGPNPGTPR